MKTPALLVCAITIALFAGAAQAQYRVPYSHFPCGAGVRSGSNIIYDSAGQAAIGISSGGSTRVLSGFWYAAGISSTVDVAISAFTAEIVNDEVILRWNASAGGELSGFFIYRAEEEAEAFARLNDEILLPAECAEYRDATAISGRSYRYQLGAVFGKEEIRSFILSIRLPPKPLTLNQNYPNPFNPSTNISFFLPDAGPVALEIFDVSGRRVRTLVNGELNAGKHTIAWSGENSTGAHVGSGVYYCRLESGKKVLTRKMVIVR